MSSNRAWMPLHIENYLADTGHLTAAEHGAYMLLIMSYWREGGLPSDERLIQRMSRLSKDEWAESRDVLAALFQEGWTHKRIDTELAKADEIIEKRRSAANGRHSKSKGDASAVHVHSKSTDTGVPPRTTEPSSSLRSEDPPPNPQGGGQVDLFGKLVEVMPINPGSKLDRAEKWFLRQPEATKRAIVEAGTAFAAWFWADQRRKSRSDGEALGFAPSLHTWLSEGGWKSVSEIPSAQPVEPMVKLDRERDEALWLACEAVMGKKAPTSDSAWSFRKSVVEQARASLAQAGAA
ncbi:YdaU family protein [Devosia sp.]|uniref:YdaU family protein n=1 Tax=Devosia sp. TaxID=1871048 RepID=UPI001AC2FFCB|nr:YdaU family protein [Devosia sp.]MBN9335068.1 YdaU family protein [Devosia sp.]